jgi:two-component system sensor histidine kinase and response regulator WspE
MGLTGESLVQSKSIKPFSDSLLKIDNSILDMIRTSDATLQDLESEEMNNEIRQKLIECNMEFKKIHESFVSHIEKFEFYTRRVENLTDRLYYEVIAIRMKPFSEGLHGFPRLVRDVSKTLGKKVRLEIIGEFTRVDRDILEKLESPLNHLIRNAVDHGIEMPEDRIAAGKPVEGVITLEARHSAGTLIISVKDDGKGIDPDKLRKKIVEKGYAPSDLAANLSNAELMDFLFLPGFSTAEAVTEISGRGVGLDVVFSMVHEVSGTLRAESIPGQGSTFYLQLPLTLSVIRTLLVDIAGEPYAIPLARIDRIMKLKEKDLLTLEDQQYCIYNETNVGIVDSYQVFERSNNGRKDDLYNIVIVSDRLNRYGIVVDSFLGQRSLVVIPIDQKLGRIPNIAAGAILEDGEPVLILDVDDLVRSIDNMLTRGKLKKLTGRSSEEELKQKRILVVDDSLTVREVERKLLENNGYEVVLAVDGIDGWNALHREQFDLLISDVDMPRMNGIELVTRVKSDSNLKRMPVMIVSYKDREEDRMRGLEAGANYYFTKSSFHDEKLISAVHDLIGEAR